MTVLRTVCAGLALVLLAAACTSDGDNGGAPDGTPGGEAATSPASPGATVSPGDGAPPPTGPTAQDLAVAPQAPLERRTSEREVGQDERGQASFDVLGAEGSGDLPAELGLAVFSCADVVLGPPEVFTDTDGDGVADRIGQTETGAAFIELINGQPFEGASASWPVPVAVDDGGALSVTMNSFDPDCAVVVVLVDEDGDGGLALDASGVPTEPFGLGKVSWVRGS